MCFLKFMKHGITYNSLEKGFTASGYRQECIKNSNIKLDKINIIKLSLV